MHGVEGRALAGVEAGHVVRWVGLVSLQQLVHVGLVIFVPCADMGVGLRMRLIPLICNKRAHLFMACLPSRQMSMFATDF